MIKVKSNINIYTSFGNVIKGQIGEIHEVFLNQKRELYPISFNTVIDGLTCLDRPFRPPIYLSKDDFIIK